MVGFKCVGPVWAACGGRWVFRKPPGVIEGGIYSVSFASHNSILLPSGSRIWTNFP